MREHWENIKWVVDDWWNTVTPLNAFLRSAIFALGVALIITSFFPLNILTGLVGGLIFGGSLVDIILLTMTMIFNFEEKGSLWDD